MSDNQKNNGLKGLIDISAEIAGGAIGGALGFLAAGPAGAALLGVGGSSAAIILRRVGEEFATRFLSHREQIRAGGVIAIAAEEMSNRIQSGETLRNDGFFDEKTKGRSDADEVTESIILKCQRESEEKKIPYMGHLMSNIAFDSTISAQLAHLIIKTAEQLTYRQLVIMKLSVIKQSFNLRMNDYRGQGSFTKELYQILYEYLDLYHRGLINFGGEVAFGPTDIKPNATTVQGLGGDIYNLMQLAKIPNNDIVPIVVQLQ